MTGKTGESETKRFPYWPMNAVGILCAGIGATLVYQAYTALPDYPLAHTILRGAWGWALSSALVWILRVAWEHLDAMTRLADEEATEATP